MTTDYPDVDDASDALAILRHELEVIGEKLPPTRRAAAATLARQRAQLRMRGYKLATVKRRGNDDARQRLDVLWRAVAQLPLVDSLQAAALQARHLLLALKLGDHVHVARGLALEAEFLSTFSRFGRRRADRALEMAKGLAAKNGDQLAHALVASSTGFSAAAAGHWTKALSEWTTAMEMLGENEDGRGHLELLRTRRLVPLYYLGRMNDMTTMVDALTGDGQTHPAALSARTGLANSVWLAQGDTDRAERELTRRGISADGATAHGVLLARTQIDLFKGEAAAAWRRVTDDWSMLTRDRVLRSQRLRVEAHQLRARAILAVLTSDTATDARIETAERDTTVLERERMPWSTALARLLRAAISKRRGDADGARAWLRAAEGDLERCDMQLYLAATRRRRGELLGGEQGAAMCAQADRYFASEGITDPERMTNMLAPGL